MWSPAVPAAVRGIRETRDYSAGGLAPSARHQSRRAGAFSINFQVFVCPVQIFLSLYAISYTCIMPGAVIANKSAIPGHYITLWLWHFVAPRKIRVSESRRAFSFT
jgi:hypothetical protein